MLTSLLLALVASAPPTATQVGLTELKPPLEHWRIDREGEPPLDAYLLHRPGRLPLVAFLPGSKCAPLFTFYKRDGKERVRGTLPWQLIESPAAAQIVLLERRGLHSGAASDPESRCSKTHGAVRKEVRVQDAVDALSALAKQPFVSDLIVVGHSEGADVTAGVVRAMGPRVAAAGLLSGAGPSQFYDEVANARRTGDGAGVKAALDDLVRLADPKTQGDYQGHEVDRYRSFAIASTPLEDLRDTPVPIFVAAGDRDHKAPIESADLFAVEMLRAHPTRTLRYLMLPGLDHEYLDAAGNEHFADVFGAFLAWALAPTRSSGVTVGLGAVPLPGPVTPSVPPPTQ